ncbi:MAG: MBL fold metallo-hydrolase [Planctomycetota bacterium]|nr:MBL fold metallo-hydrolase [Planctomycetota bacterium]
MIMPSPSPIAIHCLTVGDLGTNCYIVAYQGQGQCLVIDPGAEGERLVAEIRRLGLAPEAILFTHSHYDHIGGAEAVLRAFPQAKVMCHADCAARAANGRANFSFFLIGRVKAGPTAARHLRDGESVIVGRLTVTAWEMSGHAPGHMIFACAEAQCLFSGDLIFAGSIGRTDIPEADAGSLAASICRLFAAFPSASIIWPGHGPNSTLAAEAAHNPWVQEILRHGRR